MSQNTRFRAWPGRVEIPATDPRRSATFYSEVFGWQPGDVLRWQGEDYVGMGTARGEAGLGITTPAALGTEAPLPIIHIEGTSLDDVLACIHSAGGTTDLPPTEVDGQGTYARFRDPDGHLLGLWHPADRS